MASVAIPMVAGFAAQKLATDVLGVDPKMAAVLGMAAGGGAGEVKPPEESIVPEPENPAAPAKPAKGGRGDVRVNANGIKQLGTGMGKSVPVK